MISNIVGQSGTYNYRGCKIPVRSNLKIHRWEHRLVHYHDRDITQFLKFGWPTNHVGEFGSEGDCKNHKGEAENPEQINKYLKEETSRGATLGPFSKSPFWLPIKVSPLNAVDKKDSTEKRVILDLSFPEGNSINDGIRKREYLGMVVDLEYPTVDDFAALINRKGAGCLMYKRDLKRAYRQLFVDPGEVHKLCYKWQGKIYADKVLPMGLRSAAYICQRTTSAVVYMYRQEGHDAVVFLDDFGGAEVPDKAKEAEQDLDDLLDDLGLGQAHNKRKTGSTKMPFLGILFDSCRMTMEVDADRMVELKTLLRDWIGKSKASRKELESLVGKLNFVAKCVRPGRAFMNRMFDALAEWPHDRREYELSVDLLMDIHWWEVFLPRYSGVSLVPPNHWMEVDSIIETDACLSGCGGINYILREYFHTKFPEEVLRDSKSINDLELVGIMIALKVWGQRLKGMRVKIHCDNQVSVYAMNSSRLKARQLQAIKREIAMLAALGDFEVSTLHIDGNENRNADDLSRWHLDERYGRSFRSRCPEREWSEIGVDRQLFNMSSQWS